MAKRAAQLKKAKPKKQVYSKYRTAAYKDRLYHLFALGLSTKDIQAQIRKGGERISINTIQKLIKENKEYFEERQKRDAEAEDRASRAIMFGDNKKLQTAFVDLNVAVLNKLKESINDLELRELVTLANGLTTRHLIEIYRASRAVMGKVSSHKIQALVMGNMIAGGGKSNDTDLSDDEVDELLAGHEGGALLKSVGKG